MNDTPFTLELLDRAAEAVKAESRIYPIIKDGREIYFMTITNHMRAVLVMLRARARWKEQHRAARIARKANQRWT